MVVRHLHKNDFFFIKVNCFGPVHSKTAILRKVAAVVVLLDKYLDCIRVRLIALQRAV